MKQSQSEKWIDAEAHLRGQVGERFNRRGARSSRNKEISGVAVEQKNWNFWMWRMRADAMEILASYFVSIGCDFLELRMDDLILLLVTA